MSNSINAFSSADYFFAYDTSDFGTVERHFEILQEYFQDAGLDTIIGDIADKTRDGIALSVSIKPSNKSVAAVKNVGSQICVLRAHKKGSSVKISLHKGVLTQTIEAYVQRSYDEAVNSLEDFDQGDVA